jgi:uncharacterized protein (DUF983 family)
LRQLRFRQRGDCFKRGAMTAHALPANLPATFVQAALRGIRNRCPRCDGGQLFRTFLKPVDTCRCCGQDFTHQRADDFPAYLAILVTGHLLAPVMIWLGMETTLSLLAIFSILIVVSVIMLSAMLQPAKGAVIAAQWWHGLHGFRKERVPEAGASGSA